MLSSTLNPQAISKNSSATLNGFGDFMTGGRLASSSGITNAANKIVDFTRPNVTPIGSNINSLVTNISTNILNQVDNSIRTTTNFIKNDTNDIVDKLKKDLYSKILELNTNISKLKQDYQVEKISKFGNQDDNQSQIQTETQEKIISLQKSIENIQIDVNNSFNTTKNIIKSENEVELNDLKNDLYSRLAELQSTVNGLQKDVKVTTSEIQTQVTQQQSQVQSQSPVSGIQDIIQNLQTQVSGILDNTLRNFTTDYQQKIKGFEDNRPNNVLTKFLDLYKNAIGFVNFFGDRKNINTVDKNLKSLRKIFEESFEVAAVLRQTIIKIVNQLSNLPTASPTSGGLNLDIGVPGGRLKQSAPPGVKNVGRAARFGGIAGAGLLGLGGVGMAASGMGKAREFQESMLAEGVSPGGEAQNIPENIIESFSAIVDRFTSAVNSLIGGAKKSSGSGASGGGAGGGGGPSSGSGDGGAPGFTGSSPVADVAKDTEFISEVQKLSKETGTKPSELMALYQAESGIRPTAKNKSGATGIFQLMFDPNNPNDKRYGKTREEFASMSRADQVRAHRRYLEEVGFFKSGYKGLANLKVANIAPAFLGKGLDDPIYRSGTSAYSGNAALDQPPFGNGDGVITAREYNNFVMIRGNPKAFEKYDTMVASSVSTDGVIASPPTQQVSRAQAISQPAQQPLQTISLSPTIVDASGGTQQQGGGGGVPNIPAQPSGSGPEVPFLPTTNPENFFTMYSRIVYNIVDG